MGQGTTGFDEEDECKRALSGLMAPRVQNVDALCNAETGRALYRC